MKAAAWVRAHVGLIGLVVLLLIGLGMRLAVLDWTGHSGDISITARWAESMARYGPWDFYDHDAAVYPALLYAYWPLGLLLDGAALTRAVKGLSIPFDLALGVLLYLVARRYTRGPRALLAPALYLLNPAVILAGPVWGQVDAAGALAYMGALLAVAAARYPAAGGLATVAMLVKPQFGLVMLPVLAVAIVRGRAAGNRRPLIRVLIGAAAAYLIVTVPLRLDPIRYAGRVIYAGSLKPDTSLNAPNPWGMFVGYKIPDGPLFWVGAVLLLLGLAVALLPLRRRQDLTTILAVGLLVVFAFYFLPTRVHERYLFPAMALVVPLAAARWRVFGAYLVLAAGFALTILYGLVSTTSFAVPRGVEDVLISPTAVLWIGMTLMASAATLAILLLRPQDQARASDPPEPG